jgi:predicted acyltransferase
MQQRNNSLDALRGLAILAMVLSSSIAFGILPAWMYHAQEPPPSHAFIPTLPGITWVDLVFPFFLFSMGAAIPLALNKKIKEGTSFLPVLYIAARRYLLLVFFALFTVHARSAVMSTNPYPIHYLLSVAAFILLFFQLYKPTGPRYEKLFRVIRALAFAGAGIMLYLLPFKDGKGFSLYRSDIIIIVLANMAFFGTLIWWFTKDRPWIRLGILPFIMAVLLGAKEPGSWNEMLFQWSPLPWMYKFYYLKYLFIILPGTLAGDWLLKYRTQHNLSTENSGNAGIGRIAFLSFTIIIINVILLFGRHLLTNLILTAILCMLVYAGLKKTKQTPDHLLMLFFKAGTYLLLVGLFFEAFEGGIRKDPSTFSYYLVTSGLAFFMLMAFYGLQDTAVGGRIVHYLSLNGRNPMVAYVTGNLLLLPLLHLSGGMALYSGMQKNVATGFLSGVLFTAIVSAVTVLFTKRGWMWKT